MKPPLPLEEATLPLEVSRGDLGAAACREVPSVADAALCTALGATFFPVPRHGPPCRGAFASGAPALRRPRRTVRTLTTQPKNGRRASSATPRRAESSETLPRSGLWS